MRASFCGDMMLVHVFLPLKFPSTLTILGVALLLSSQLALAQFSQQGPKLVGADAVSSEQGHSVGMSSDGNTAIIGGWGDNQNNGAAWIFIRSNGVWAQQGPKLVGDGAVGNAVQGVSVSLSGDGNTAIVGGPRDNLSIGSIGAAWVFTHSGGVWIQEGSKLVGSGAVLNSGQGQSVALSGDGSTSIVGGMTDNANVGAAWVFIQTRTATHDYNDDGYSDIAWRDNSGNVAFWLMNGPFYRPAALAACPSLGRSSACAISTATAWPICCGATQAATPPCGS
jgi:hypothetical protein